MSVEHCPKEVADDIVRKTTQIQLAIAVGLMLDAVDRRRGVFMAYLRLTRDACRAAFGGLRLGRSLGLGRADAISAVISGLREFRETLGGAP